MKVFVATQLEWDDYSDCPQLLPITWGVIVPDDFDPQSTYQQWYQETGIPGTVKNQYGEWKIKSFKGHTMTFADWLRKKYEGVEVVSWAT